jgi:hypothetical protein
LKGAIRDRDRQKFLVKSFDIATDEVSQQPGTRPVARARPRSKLRVLAGRSGRSASRGAVAKATHAHPFKRGKSLRPHGARAGIIAWR